jgi:hypothetical protein
MPNSNAIGQRACICFDFEFYRLEFICPRDSRGRVLKFVPIAIGIGAFNSRKLKANF